MQKLRTFFLTLFKSVTQPAYYNDVLVAPSSFSWKYFLFFHLLLTFVVIVRFMMPLAAFDVNSAISEAFSVYPQDLEVLIANEEVTINKPLPYVVPFPAQMFDGGEKETPFDEEQEINLVTFVEEGAITSIQEFYGYNSVAVVTPTTMYFLKDTDTGEVRSYPIPATEQPVNIDAALLNDFKTKIVEAPIVKQKLYVPLIGVFALIFFYPGIVLWKVLTLAIYSVVIYFVAAIFMRSKNLTFGEIFQMGLHAITAVVLATLIADLALQFQIGGWWYFLLYFVCMLVILSQVRTMAPLSAHPAEAKPKKVAHHTKTKK